MAAINAKIASTEVSEGGFVPVSGVVTGVAVSDMRARAVRVSRMKASWVAAPGEGETVTSMDVGTRVSVMMIVPFGVNVGVAEGVKVTVWNGEVGVAVEVLVGVRERTIKVEVGYLVRVRVGVGEGRVRVAVGVTVLVEVVVGVAGMGVTEIVPVSKVVRSKLTTFKR